MYVGHLAYLSNGYYGTIVEYHHSETIFNKEAAEKWVIKPKWQPKDVFVTVSDKKKLVLLDYIKFFAFGDTTACAVVPAGQTLPSIGYAVRHPKDRQDDRFARRLALARALGDCQEVDDRLDAHHRTVDNDAYYTILYWTANARRASELYRPIDDAVCTKAIELHDVTSEEKAKAIFAKKLCSQKAPQGKMLLLELWHMGEGGCYIVDRCCVGDDWICRSCNNVRSSQECSSADADPCAGCSCSGHCDL